MNNPLEELRKWIAEWQSREVDAGDIEASSVLSLVLITMDAFVEEHPGLHDLTEPCEDCGAPVDGFEMPAFGYEGEYVYRDGTESTNCLYPVCESCFVRRGGKVKVNPETGYRYGLIYKERNSLEEG